MSNGRYRHLADFAEKTSPLVGEPWTAWPYLRYICEQVEDALRRPNPRVIINSPPRHGKALEVSTLVPTPTGWSKIGELAVGDMVFDGDGNPTRTVAISPVWKRRRCFAAIADSGPHIVADEAHEWQVRMERKRPHVRTTWETGALAARTSDRKPMVSRHRGLQLPDVDLPIDPYVLGFWLGDGHSSAGAVTVGEQDQEHVLGRIGQHYYITRRGPATFGLTKPLAEKPFSYEAPDVPRRAASCAARAHGVGGRFLPVENPADRFWSNIDRQYGPTRPGELDPCWAWTGSKDGHGYGVAWVGETILAHRYAWQISRGRDIGGLSVGHRCCNESCCNPGHLFLDRNLQAELRVLGVLDNKHIPMLYLRASMSQRWELLRGLIDSDGYVAKDGQVEFCSCNERLATGVRELVYSLGYKAMLVHGRATLHGLDCGEKFRVLFYAPGAASIPRKADRCVEPHRQPNHYLEFEEAGCEDTVCIEVESDLHTFLAGEAMIPTCNSLCLSQWLPTWALELEPRQQVMLCSYVHPEAAKWGRRVRDIFSHPVTMTRVRPDVAAADNWETMDGGGMRSAGVGGPITGRGFHLGLIDDPIKNAEEASSPVVKEHQREWYASTFRTRAEPGAAIIINMTRWADDDLAGWLLEESAEEWTHIRLPALAEPGDPIGRMEGDALCPERYSVDALRRIEKAVGSRAFAGLFQQNPLPAEGSIIKPQWLRYYEKAPEGIWVSGISVDATFQETNSGSYVSMQVWGEHGSDCYLLDQVRERMDFAATLNALMGLIAKWPGAVAKWIERKANGAAIISMLRKEVRGLIPVEPQGSKEARLQAASPLFEAGNVWLPKHAPWLGEYVTELTRFPNAKNDDQVDATSQALIKIATRRRGRHSLSEQRELGSSSGSEAPEYTGVPIL